MNSHMFEVMLVNENLKKYNAGDLKQKQNKLEKLWRSGYVAFYMGFLRNMQT